MFRAIGFLRYLVQTIKENSLNLQITYNILGGGYYLKDLRRFLGKFTDIPDNLQINVRGYSGNLENFYKNTDIVVYCSTLDGTPSVLLEAQSYGLPLLVNSYEAFHNILEENINAFFFDDNEQDSFSEKFIRLVNDEALREEMGRNNIKNIEENYSLKAVTKEWESFLLEQGMLIR